MQNSLARGAKDEDLHDRRLFALAAAGGSFSSAARAMGVNASTVTRAIERLERSLGARLFSRSTHQLSLTEAGRAYRQWIDRMLAEEARLRDEISGGEEARGTLRVSVPVFVADRILGPVLERLHRAHANARFEVHAGNERVDIVAGAWDLAVRAGPLDDSSLRARRIARFRRVLVAAPSLLKSHRAPRTPEDLPRLPSVAFGGRGRVRWQFRKAQKRVSVELQPLVVANSLELLVALAARGVGVTLIPDWAMGEGLVPILGEWTEAQRAELWAVHPDDPGKARLRNAFIEALLTQARKE